MCGHEYDTDPTHVRQFSYDKLEKILGEYFTNVDIFPIEGKILPFWSVGKDTPKEIAKLFARDLLWRCFK